MNRNSQIYLFDVGLIYSLIPGGLSFLPYIRPFYIYIWSKNEIEYKEKSHNFYKLRYIINMPYYCMQHEKHIQQNCGLNF